MHCGGEPGKGPQLVPPVALCGVDEDVVLPHAGNGHQKEEHQAVGVQRVEGGDPEDVLEEKGVELRDQDDRDGGKGEEAAAGAGERLAGGGFVIYKYTITKYDTCLTNTLYRESW